ncbi:protein SAMBA isoform X1 [Vitis riparia]|uniref:protein SAMBA isoform X1 n=1 Tax=Vitis riparia TaxID=96939 RepID=UPI00155B38C9|nr:protein SAMBA isoform X1 [Vitis riparia]
MNGTSPAHSTISGSAVVGGGSSSAAALALEDFPLPSDPISIQDRKDEALLVLKSDLMAALNKEVKSLDEDNWKFDGPRSRIHLLSRLGGLLHKRVESTNHRNFPFPK